ncbi:Rrf2 family transcriptional regulator [Anaerotignum sp.]|uniref:RrF2 family transcriptional regulator n=1 Tax=Anaerotignum sp. TaxID=2039241 RepID=UPI00332F3172
MMISTKGRYALRVMIDLAEHAGGYVPLKEIAERQDISEKYLEIIIKSLVKEKILMGQRGKGGGYRLNKAPDAYTIGGILRITEGSLAPVACLDEKSEQCHRMHDCRTIKIWQGLDALIAEYLDGITIADLMESHKPGDNYVI